MAATRAVLFALFASCLCTARVSASDAEKNRPVTKIINMLKEMVEELTKEGEVDQETYEQMECWCESNERTKTKAIADGEARVNQLTSSIKGLTATSARLNEEIADLTKEVAKNEEALDSATSLRKKQLAEFTAEEKDMLSSITSMKGAVVALSKHHESCLQASLSLRRGGSASASGAASAASAALELRSVLARHEGLVREVVTHHERKILDSYLTGTPASTSFLQASYQQPQSGEIFGILQGMKESFEKNLAQSQAEETENNNAYSDLKAAKESEIAAGSSLIETKTQELATADEKNAVSKQDLEDTSNTLEADTEFLGTVKAQCGNMDAEFAERTKTRQMEIEATNKALSFLTSDEAHDLFTRTFNMAFVQTRQQRGARAAALRILADAGKHVRDPAFAGLQARMRNVAFENVVKDIQGLVDKLAAEQKAEVELRDFCIKEFNANEKATEQKIREKDDLTAKIDDLDNQIHTLSKEIKELEAAVADAKVQLKRAGEDREKQNKEFQVTVADQRATQKLLRGALNALKSFYDAALIQVKTDSAQPKFKTYEKNKKSGGVTGMIEGVIGDAQALEAEAITGEEESQKAYEDFVKDTNDAIDVMTKDLANKNEDKAKAEVEKVESETEKDGVVGNLEQLANAKADLHKECDYTMKNFDLRQSSRIDEMESLKQAINIFSAGSFIQFLQQQ